LRGCYEQGNLEIAEEDGVLIRSQYLCHHPHHTNLKLTEIN